MAEPSKYQREYSFSGFQASNPSKSLPAPPLDNELENIELAIGSLVDASKDLRRADGQLNNGVVKPDSLSVETISYLAGVIRGLLDEGGDTGPVLDLLNQLLEAISGIEDSLDDLAGVVSANVRLVTGLTIGADATADQAAANVAQINATVAAAKAAGGGVVKLPPGIIMVGTNTIVNGDMSGVYLVADKGATTLRLRDSMAKQMLAINGSSFGVIGITFDMNDFETDTTSSAIYLQGVSDFVIADNRITKMGLAGINAIGATRGLITRNLIEKTTARNYENRAITLSVNIPLGLTNSDIEISRNVCKQAGCGIFGVNLDFSHNTVTDFMYGGGVFTGHDDTYSRDCKITHNYFSTPYTGFDTDSTYCTGVENSGLRTLIAHNTIMQMSGGGITSINRDARIEYNTIVDTGRGEGVGGIVLVGRDPAIWGPNYNPSGTRVVGNKSYNSGGAAGAQKWAYEENTMYGGFVDIEVWGNTFGLGFSNERVKMQPTTKSDEMNTWAASVAAPGASGFAAAVLYSRFNRNGRVVSFEATIHVTALGTGTATTLNITVPSNAKSGAIGRGMNVGLSAACNVNIGADGIAKITRYDGAFPVTAAPQFITISGSYEEA